MAASARDSEPTDGGEKLLLRALPSQGLLASVALRALVK
jgi:hypothetical protein